MNRYAVALSLSKDDSWPAYWIEFYDADDSKHAYEQAKDANPDAEILCIAWVR